MNKPDRIIYADNAATTAVDPRVVEAMLPLMCDNFGNPSSQFYSIGRRARAALEEARASVARVFNCSPDEIYFTSGGSESDNWALKGVARALAPKKRHIITSAIEHHAILHSAAALEKDGLDVTYLGVDKNGVVDLSQLAAAIRPDTALVSVMFANNEIGTVEPVREIGKIAKERGVAFHTDAVQAAGHCDIDLAELGDVDLMSISAHKFHGPKGVGALFIRRGTKIASFLDGGAQERGRRATTENVAGVVGLAAALGIAAASREENSRKIGALSARLTEGLLKIPHTRLNGHPTQRLDNNVNISFLGVEGETILMDLDRYGICASTGSACASGSLDPSHVLLAIGLRHEEAHCSIRFTLGEDNTDGDVDYIINSMREILEFRRSMSPLYEDILKGENA